MSPLTNDQVREAVRERYAAAATAHRTAPATSGCGCDAGCCGDAGHDERAVASSCCAPTCCAPTPFEAIDPITSGLYDEADVPFDAALAASLGCGNPSALAELSPGEDVLDLGSGAGLDVLLSARRVGPAGTAYGLDMAPEMHELAQQNGADAGIENAHFLLGTIEHVPLPDAAVDVVISNCVINLAADKDVVLREAFRVLRPGGRFAVSDIVFLTQIPEQLRGVARLWTGCISGALRDIDYVDKLTAAGFANASVEVTRTYDREAIAALATQLDAAALPATMALDEAIDALAGAVASAFVRATKP